MGFFSSSLLLFFPSSLLLCFSSSLLLFFSSSLLLFFSSSDLSAGQPRITHCLNSAFLYLTFTHHIYTLRLRSYNQLHKAISTGLVNSASEKKKKKKKKVPALIPLL